MSWKPSKVGQGDLVFGFLLGCASGSVHTRLQVSVCTGYDLCHPGCPKTFLSIVTPLTPKSRSNPGSYCIPVKCNSVTWSEVSVVWKRMPEIWAIPPPTNRELKNQLFGPTSQPNGNFNGLYLRNETPCRQSVKCIANYKGSPTSS